jgi:hypothetical protein
MVKGSRFVTEKEDATKKIIVVKLDVKELGALFALHDVLPSYIENYERIYRNNENKELIIEGSTLADVRTGMRKWGNGMATGGHGGYRFNYNISSRQIDPIENARNEIIAEYQDVVRSLEEEIKKLKNVK